MRYTFDGFMKITRGIDGYSQSFGVVRREGMRGSGFFTV
jgi:hypothetical protein